MSANSRREFPDSNSFISEDSTVKVISFKGQAHDLSDLKCFYMRIYLTKYYYIFSLKNLPHKQKEEDKEKRLLTDKVI